VTWSTADEQLQFKHSMRQGMMHVTSRHMMAVIAPICVLHWP